MIENNESGIPDKTLYWNILKVLGKQSTDTFTEQEASSVEELEIVNAFLQHFLCIFDDLHFVYVSLLFCLHK